MQVDMQEYLATAEKANRIAFFDFETGGLNADYNSILIASIKPYKGKVKSFYVKKPGYDKDVVLAISAELEKYPIWISWYGKAFDVPFLNARRCFYGLGPLIRDKHNHLDLYWTARFQFKLSSNSLAHMLSWFRTPEQKMTVSADDWNTKNIPVLIKRCESDVLGLQQAYEKMKVWPRNAQRY